MHEQFCKLMKVETFPHMDQKTEALVNELLKGPRRVKDQIQLYNSRLPEFPSIAIRLMCAWRQKVSGGRWNRNQWPELWDLGHKL